MRTIVQILIICTTLLAFGVAKLHFEDRLTQDMVQHRLLQPPLKEGTSQRLGQTGAAAALGGMRSLIATVWNLRAFLHFENLEWIKLEQSYEVITTLQPQTIHYWETGAWHLHTNASVYYNENPDLSPFRQREMRKLYIQKGSALLEEGLLYNPDSWRLHSNLARIWSDRYKLPDLNRAVNHYSNTLACDTLPDYRRSMFERFRFYTMTRIPSRHAESLELGLVLYHQSPRNRTPSLVNYLFALQNELDLPEADRIPDNELYPSKKLQLQWLKNLWKRRNQAYPMAGVRVKIEELKKENQPKNLFKVPR